LDANARKSGNSEKRSQKTAKRPQKPSKRRQKTRKKPPKNKHPKRSKKTKRLFFFGVGSSRNVFWKGARGLWISLRGFE